MDKRKTYPGEYITAIAAAAVGIGLLKESAAVSAGIFNGLKSCANILIPALFPFMALSSYLSFSSAARILSFPLKPVTTRIFKLPGELGAIVLLSLVGGYPVGAKGISLLLSQQKISKSTAERMLCFCVNSGPSFLISAVGTGMLFSKTAGLILFASQTCATLLIGAAVSLREKAVPLQNAKTELKGAEAFVASVSAASSAMFMMCSFAALFSGVLPLISETGAISAAARLLNVKENVLSALVSGFFEVTSGCANAARIGGTAGFGLISAIVSFGGLSVLFQIMSCFRENSVRFAPLIFSRLAHIFISTSIAVPLYRIFCETQTTFAQAGRPVFRGDTRTAFISACLLCMCAVMTLDRCQYGKNRIE